MKKIITIVLVFSLVISNFVFASAINLPNETEWYYKAVKYCDENGLIDGVLTGEIKDEPLTRAEFLTIFMNVMDVDVNTIIPTNEFKDVEKNSWYEKSIYWAYANKVTNGTSVDTFSPENNITREEAATMIMRYFNEKNVIYPTTEAVEFVDKANFSDYAKDSIAQAAKYGLFKGDEKKNFNPKKNITQPEGLTLFMRIHKDFISGNLSFPVYEPTPEGDITEPKPNPEENVGGNNGNQGNSGNASNSDVITPVPDLFVTYNGKEYNLTKYEDFKAFVKIIKDPRKYGPIFEEKGRITTPGGNITWHPPQKLKATDPIKENISKLSEDNLAPIEWLENDDFRQLREDIAKCLNDQRVEAGGGTLTIDEGLMATAQNKAEMYARVGTPPNHNATISYTGWTPGCPKNQYGNQRNGAEILLSVNYKPDPNIAVGVWMASEGHREMIVGEHDRCVGVGVAKLKHGGYAICAIFNVASTYNPYLD